jgi:hypothetical protein
VRRECLDRLLSFGPAHLDAVLTEYLAHYNAHGPHRALGHRPPYGRHTTDADDRGSGHCLPAQSRWQTRDRFLILASGRSSALAALTRPGQIRDLTPTRSRARTQAKRDGWS